MAVWLLYLLLVGVGVVCFRGETLPEAPPRPAFRSGRLPLFVLAVCTPSLIPPLWMRWGAEFGSIWCWGASAAMLSTLAEPRLAHWAHRCHRSLREASSSGCKDPSMETCACGWAIHVGAMVWRDVMMVPSDVVELQIREQQQVEQEETGFS